MNKKLEDLKAKNYKITKQLLIGCVVSSAIKCNHKSKKDELPYLKWFEFADNEIANGRKQTKCIECFKWLFPSEV